MECCDLPVSVTFNELTGLDQMRKQLPFHSGADEQKHKMKVCYLGPKQMNLVRSGQIRHIF